MQFMISLDQDSTGGLAGFWTQDLIRLILRCQPRMPFSSELGIFFQATVDVRTHSIQLQDKNPSFLPCGLYNMAICLFRLTGEHCPYFPVFHSGKAWTLF